MIERWEFPTVRDAMVFNSREDVEEYLARVASGSRANAATVMAAQARSRGHGCVYTAAALGQATSPRRRRRQRSVGASSRGSSARPGASPRRRHAAAACSCGYAGLMR